MLRRILYVPRCLPGFPGGGGTVGEVVTSAGVEELAARLRRAGKRLVLTNGCFDLLHVGHLRYLAAAKALGDVLLVGVNADEEVRRQKGPSRPFVPATERVELVAGLVPVDYAFIFTEPTATGLVLAIRPDVYAKGGDYNPANLPEMSAVTTVGARLVFLPFVAGRSTTELAMLIAGRLGANGV
ncbi:MAG: adenylyltransferase/cytidyltransferase family protein [Firmicutes bacterium]|nr:adenylyltransferase/cytidyltransferase family protein [Bacillota bacterium]